MKQLAASALSHGLPNPTTAEQLLDLACAQAPVLERTLAEFGNQTLLGYLDTLTPESVSPYQGRSDLLDALYQYAAPLLGEAVAVQAAEDLERSPMVLTANHHGVDYFSQSVQGTLLFSLSKGKAGKSPVTVPVLSCGNIPMNNLTYPLGMLFYQVNANSMESSPRKLPIFPDRHKRTMVSAVCGYDRMMVDRAMKRIDGMCRNEEIGPRVAACAKDILSSQYCDPQVMEMRSYSEQSVVLNHRTWKRLFADPGSATEVVYLEMEKIVGRLLEADLSNPQSLAWRVMFDRELRKPILEGLDGHRICWHRRNLSRRLYAVRGDGREQVPANGCGTLYFWGIDPAGRKIPLTIEQDAAGAERLRGVDDRGEIWDFPFTPSALIQGLQENRLIPSLFTCYLTVSLARGVICLGGYYQAEYLPAMQQGLLNGLSNIPKYHHMLEPIGRVRTDGYLSGMQTVMTRISQGHLVPAGPLEIIAGGGLTEADLARVGSLTLREAHLASLSETVADIADDPRVLTEWKTQLAADCYQLLADKIVIK